MLVRYPAKLLCDAKYVRYRRSKSLSHLWVRAKPANIFFSIAVHPGLICDLTSPLPLWHICQDENIEQLGTHRDH